jgi:uncharacterized protein (DUF2236 family)
MTVQSDDLEGFLAELEREVRAAGDPAAGIFGPRSMMWRVSRESITFLGGGRAALLQLAHPWVATAVQQHSRSESDLPGRFQRTFNHVFALVFGDLDAALASARRVHALHATVTGHLEEALGPWPREHRYEANDEAALLWVQATLVDTSVLMYETFIGPLSDADKEALWQDNRRFARLFGISDATLPPTWAAFRNYFDATVASDLLTVGAASRRMAHFLLTPPNTLVTPAWRWYAALTTGFLPERLRPALGFAWGRSQRLVFGATLAALKVSWRRLPSRLRWLPAYVDARRRLRGEARDPLGLVAERLVLGALRQERRT